MSLVSRCSSGEISTMSLLSKYSSVVSRGISAGNSVRDWALHRTTVFLHVHLGGQRASSAQLLSTPTIPHRFIITRTL